ncbi:MAG: T9SS type A sorting domain-containing protein [Caldithrix sp.]|nr:MAG: T9SS type A sorting domain-containing protein [Caldithrix sp.]
MLRWGGSLFLFFLTTILSGSNLFSQTNSVNRDHDAIIISGEMLATFDGALLSELFLYSFDEQSKTFTQIPFQFDERDISGSFFITDDGLLDDNDELVFMASDLGDRDPADPPAAPGNWLTDVISMTNPRVEISATDSLSSPALSKRQGVAQGWVYLFRSSSLIKEFTEDYVTYTEPPGSNGDDMIAGQTYTIGATAKGFFGNLFLPDNSNPDLLEGQQIRVDTNFFPTISEDDFNFQSIDFIDGPVRVIRHLNTEIPFVAAVTIPFQYFQSTVLMAGNLSIPTSLPLGLKIVRIQHSINLSSSAIGMTFDNQFNTDIAIDGVDDTVNTSIETSPEVNNTHVTGNQGTIVSLFSVPSTIGSSQNLFYQDNSGSGSIGNSGLEVSGNDVEGNFPIAVKFVLTGPNQPSSVGAQLASFEENPLVLNTLSQTFNQVVPVELAAFTAAVVGNDVSLVWITATETNNFGFDIQRKFVESDSWEKIHFVAGHGSTTTQVPYRYTDENLALGSYNYRLKQIDTNGSFEFSAIITVEVGVPEAFALNQNFPNPFNPSTTINYQISTAALKDALATETTLTIFNILGARVLTLVNEEQGTGFYSVVWNGKDSDGLQVPSGVYIYQLTAGSFKETKKMLLIQ